MTSSVLYERQQQVAIITLNRPALKNAIDTSIRQGLFDAWRRFEEDTSARVAILTGAGNTFSAGMDLKEAAHLALQQPPADFLPLPRQNISLSKPTIAAVSGHAIAAGWLLAQQCDLCVATPDSCFAITEVKVGRGTPWAYPLIHLLPQRIAMEVLITGKPLTGARLFELGFVNQLATHDSLLDCALTLAKQIALNAPLSVAACRELVYLSAEWGREELQQNAESLFAPVFTSEDAQEGPKAFAEKRPPQWRGR